MNYKLVVCSVLLNFYCHYSYSTIIQVNDADTLIHGCLQKIMTLLFGVEETVAFIFDNETDIIFPSEIKNPRTITIISKPIKVALTYYYNYIIVTKKFDSLKQTIEELIRCPLWNKSNSPRGKFLVFMFFESQLNEIIEYFWQLDITNLVLVTRDISDNSLKVYKIKPFYQKGKCVTFLKEKAVDPCNMITDLTFPRITTLSGCHIRLVDTQDVGAILQQPGRAYATVIRVIKLIAKVLKANLTFQQTQNIRQAVYNRTEDIILYYFLSRLETLYGDYDISNYFLKEGLVWILPKSPKLSGYKIMTSLFQATFWGALLIIFLITVLLMWFAGKCVSNQIGFKSLQRCSLIILMFSLDISANILPNNNTLRILIIFYLIYCIQISTVFRGKLISALTEPGHERSISTVEEFANLELPVVVSKAAKNTLQLDKGSIDEKLRKRMIIAEPHVMLETVMAVAYDRNITSYCAESLLRKVLPEINSMIDVISQNTGILPMECIITMRKGHHLYHVFNEVIYRIVESGFQDKVLSDFAEERPVKRKKITEANVVLTLAHLYTVFRLWTAGIMISTVIFVMEKVLKSL